MESCPACKAERKEDADVCPVCGLARSDNQEGWMIVGSVNDRISADFVLETMKSCNIPAVVISRSGFFGTAGLPLTPFHSVGSGEFEISVPAEYKEEAEEIFNMTVGSTTDENETEQEPD